MLASLEHCTAQWTCEVLHRTGQLLPWVVHLGDGVALVEGHQPAVHVYVGLHQIHHQSLGSPASRQIGAVGRVYGKALQETVLCWSGAAVAGTASQWRMRVEGKIVPLTQTPTMQ